MTPSTLAFSCKVNVMHDEKKSENQSTFVKVTAKKIVVRFYVDTVYTILADEIGEWSCTKRLCPKCQDTCFWLMP